jgi:hypothetical protein
MVVEGEAGVKCKLNMPVPILVVVSWIRYIAYLQVKL